MSDKQIADWLGMDYQKYRDFKIKRRVKIDIDIIVAIEKEIGMPASLFYQDTEYLPIFEKYVTGEGEMLRERGGIEVLGKGIVFQGPTKPVPYYRSLEAWGGTPEVFHDEYSYSPDALIYLPEVRECDLALRVRGDSMSPRICENDIIAVKKIEEFKALDWRKPYVIITKTHRKIKYIYKGEPGTIILVSANANYEPEIISVEDILYFYEVRVIIKQEFL